MSVAAEALDIRPRTGTGVLPCQDIHAMLKSGELVAPELLSDQVQPSSIDLRLGPVAWRVPTSFLPGAELTVPEKIKQLDGYAVDMQDGAVLEKGCVYVIPLQERLELKSGLAGFANPKSSTGRLDILTRLITDRGTAFDQVERGYKGPLYVEVAPRTFSVVVRPGTRLNQLRFRRGTPSVTIEEWRELLASQQVVRGEEKPGEPGMLRFTVDLRGQRQAQIGYRARKHTDRIDLAKIAHYDTLDFWEPIHSREQRLILDPDEFYILMTHEEVGVPPGYAAEMVPYDTRAGEFRVHYAGFFDPGFGWNPQTKKAGGSRGVLEVRSHEVPFLLEHGQTVGWLRYERMAARPEMLYGAGGFGSNYQGQSLKLAKQFKAPS